MLALTERSAAMKAILVMYDSLNRKFLQPYGCTDVPTPNFERLSQRAVTFDCDYAGSLPCMPARRELHTGRLNFEHRSWGPLEPFDDSMPEILKNNGIFTHLTTDHYHYWQDGGATYHSRYSTFEFSRGQESDAWKTNDALLDAVHRKEGPGRINRNNMANREFQNCEEKMSQAVTFRSGLDFIDANHDKNDWFLQIETFDPHEPFFTQPSWQKAFPDTYSGDPADWPPYYFVTEDADLTVHLQNQYKALITMCDHYLGTVLDRMDRYHMWDDTLLIVNTDHGYLLGEHGWWSKSIMPVYDEICHLPLFVHDPRCSEKDGTRCGSLTQTIDIAPTLLEFFDVPVPKDMQGKSLLSVIERNETIHDAILFGYHEGHCNVTDGRYVYMRSPEEEKPNFEYTLMPTHMQMRFQPSELQNITLQEPFDFTKGCRTMKIQAKPGMNSAANFGPLLFDLQEDPDEKHPVDNPELEARLANKMLDLMHEDDCPEERYERFDFPKEGHVAAEDILAYHKKLKTVGIPDDLQGISFTSGSKKHVCLSCPLSAGKYHAGRKQRAVETRKKRNGRHF